MNDAASKALLQIHLILEASKYSRRKTDLSPKIGKPGEAISELTSFDYRVMSPGKESNLSNTYLTRKTFGDYEQLCNLNALGLEDRAHGDQQSVYEQFTRSNEGWYATVLTWIQNHDLPKN